MGSFEQPCRDSSNTPRLPSLLVTGSNEFVRSFQAAIRHFNRSRTASWQKPRTSWFSSSNSLVWSKAVRSYQSTATSLQKCISPIFPQPLIDEYSASTTLYRIPIGELHGGWPPRQSHIGHRHSRTAPLLAFTCCQPNTPLQKIDAGTIYDACIVTWISHFGPPVTITIDPGSQFQAKFYNLPWNSSSLRRHKRSLTPKTNGMVEVWHRSLKVFLMCHETNDWVEQLLILLLEFWTALKDSFGASAVKLLFEKLSVYLRISFRHWLSSGFDYLPR